MNRKYKIELVSVKDRLPDGTEVPLLCIYENGNIVWAMGYYSEVEKEWEIEYSDDHPSSEDVKFWVDVMEDT